MLTLIEEEGENGVHVLTGHEGNRGNKKVSRAKVYF